MDARMKKIQEFLQKNKEADPNRSEIDALKKELLAIPEKVEKLMEYKAALEESKNSRKEMKIEFQKNGFFHELTCGYGSKGNLDDLAVTLVQHSLDGEETVIATTYALSDDKLRVNQMDTEHGMWQRGTENASVEEMRYFCDTVNECIDHEIEMIDKKIGYEEPKHKGVFSFGNRNRNAPNRPLIDAPEDNPDFDSKEDEFGG